MQANFAAEFAVNALNLTDIDEFELPWGNITDLSEGLNELDLSVDATTSSLTLPSSTVTMSTSTVAEEIVAENTTTTTTTTTIATTTTPLPNELSDNWTNNIGVVVGIALVVALFLAAFRGIMLRKVLHSRILRRVRARFNRVVETGPTTSSASGITTLPPSAPGSPVQAYDLSRTNPSFSEITPNLSRKNSKGIAALIQRTTPVNSSIVTSGSQSPMPVIPLNDMQHIITDHKSRLDLKQTHHDVGTSTNYLVDEHTQADSRRQIHRRQHSDDYELDDQQPSTSRAGLSRSRSAVHNREQPLHVLTDEATQTNGDSPSLEHAPVYANDIPIFVARMLNKPASSQTTTGTQSLNVADRRPRPRIMNGPIRSDSLTSASTTDRSSVLRRSPIRQHTLYRLQETRSSVIVVSDDANNVTEVHI